MLSIPVYFNIHTQAYLQDYTKTISVVTTCMVPIEETVGALPYVTNYALALFQVLTFFSLDLLKNISQTSLIPCACSLSSSVNTRERVVHLHSYLFNVTTGLCDSPVLKVSDLALPVG